MVFAQAAPDRLGTRLVLIAAYGCFRFLGEFTRNPDDGIFGLMTFGVSMGQWLSVPMVLAGIALMMWSKRKAATKERG